MKTSAKPRPEADRDVRAPQTWQLWGAIALLVTVIVAAYANSFHGPFVFDDKPSIVENQSIRKLGSLHVLAASPQAVSTVGRPLVNLSLAINYAAGGLKVEGYHVVNLAIHILAALALLGLLRRTLLLPTLPSGLSEASTGLAVTVALLWAVHPLQTESVTYTVQRAEAMVGLFYLLTLYCFVRGATAPRGGTWFAAAVGACALGMASKEVMVSAPLVAFVYDGIFISGSFKESLRRRWRFWLALSATWLLLGTLVLLSQRRGDSAGFGLGMTAWQYAERQVGCVLHYLRLAFWPSPLVLDYGNATVRAPTRFVPAALGVFLLLAATVAALIFRPKLGFLAFCFFAILAPTSSIVPLAGQTEAEHRMYLPLAAVTTLVVLAGYRLAKRVTLPWWAAAVPVLGMAAALGGGTSQRNQVYRSELVLWDDTVRSWPINYRAYHNRANAYLAMGNFDAAIGDFKKEVELNPRDPRSYANLGDGYSAAGDFEQAIRSYDRAIRLKPTFARAYNGRGSCHGNLGNVEEALADFDRAIALDPTLAEAHYNSGNAFGSKGQIDHAIRDYGRAIELEPDYADAYNQRAAAYESQGNVAAALRDLDKAIELRPDNASAFYNRALVRFEAKAYDQARADVQAFQRLGGKPSAELTDALTRASGRSQ